MRWKPGREKRKKGIKRSSPKKQKIRLRKEKFILSETIMSVKKKNETKLFILKMLVSSHWSFYTVDTNLINRWSYMFMPNSDQAELSWGPTANGDAATNNKRY